jgi:glyoxylase-like metal-dependent hydrolase (beta-lactamase superfamily II)
MEAQLRGDAPQAPRPFDAHNHRRSLQELKLFAREYPDAIVTPGHDPEFYARLEKRYE